MANKDKFSPSEIINAIRELSKKIVLTEEGLKVGVSVSYATLAQSLEVTDQTIRNYVTKYKNVAKAFEKAKSDRRALMLSKAEDNLELALIQREWKATQFVLSTLGKEIYNNRNEMGDLDGLSFIPISEETEKLLAETGLDAEFVSEVFNRMVAANAAEWNRVDG